MKEKIEVTVIIMKNSEILQTLEIGNNFKLEKDEDNPHDKTAVRVIEESTGSGIGYLAASESTALPLSMLASEMFVKLGNPKLDEAWVRITSMEEKGKYVAAKGTCSFIPKQKKKAANKAHTIIVGGANAVNPLKADFIKGMLAVDYENNPQTVYIQKEILGLGNKTRVFCTRTSNDANQLNAIGDVIDPSAELLNALKKQTIAAKFVGFCDEEGKEIPEAERSDKFFHRFFRLEYTPDNNVSENVTKAIKKAVREVRGKTSDLNEKVKYLLDQGVPENIVCKYLEKTDVTDYVDMVPNPPVKYAQEDAYGELTRALAYRLSNMNIRFIGNKGSGKNTLVETVDWLTNTPQYRMQGNAEMDKLDLLGSPTIKSGNMEYQLSDMLKYLQIGANVVLDEGNTIKPEVADLLHSLTDESRKIEVPGYGLVVMSPVSTITITMNEDYMGTTRMNEATVDRFVPIQMSQPTSITELLAKCVPAAGKDSVNLCNRVYGAIKNEIEGVGEMGSLEPDCMTIRGFIDALRAEALLGLKIALLDNVANKPQDSYSRMRLNEIITAILP